MAGLKCAVSTPVEGRCEGGGAPVAGWEVDSTGCWVVGVVSVSEELVWVELGSVFFGAVAVKEFATVRAWASRLVGSGE